MKKLNTILLIDDNLDDNFFHSLVIKGVNASIVIKSATTGEKAIDYLNQAQNGVEDFPIPDLIFLDINMPGMNGFEFLEKARLQKIISEDKTVVIVMLTSSLNPSDEEMAKKQFPNEINAYQNKPLTKEILNDIIVKFFSS